MLDESIRTAILELAKQGHGIHAIKRMLGLSRQAVRDVLRKGTAEVPRLERTQKADGYREQILEQYARCKGNLVRVHEELCAQGADFSYPALTAYCRQHSIGHKPKEPAGRYEFGPGEEMQHDTSPHVAPIAGRVRKVQIASLVLCYAHLLFFQLYPTFNRFLCKVFLTAALRYFGGAARRCMVDNTSVIRLQGTGAHMVPVPEMQSFGERYGFVFVAHEIGDANRSGRVEAPFGFIQRNFLAGRDFADWNDSNGQAASWCDKVNRTYKKHLRAVPYELFVAERAHLQPLPLWVPEVYQLHQRIVDLEGYVTVHTNRYSAPYELLGRTLEVRESYERVELYQGPRLVARHHRVPEPQGSRVTDPKHRPPRGQARPATLPLVEEEALLAAVPELAEYICALKRRDPGRGTQSLRRLLGLLRDYPRESFREALRSAAHYGLYDLGRVERMILRCVARDFFVLGDPSKKEPPDDG
jgi:hypothetical protein